MGGYAGGKRFVPLGLDLHFHQCRLRWHGLPPLKAADMMKDMELIRETEQAAEQLLQDDPTLQQPENQGLRLEVLRLFAKTGENGVIL